MSESAVLHARVSRSALVDNARLVADRVSPAALAVVVKDDAYAHGLEEVVGTLRAAGVDRFGALDLATALRVRRLAPAEMIFTWVFGENDDLRAAIDAELDLGVSYPAILERVAEAASALGRPARVHLKIDTGLHRAGVPPREWPAFVERAAILAGQGLIDVVGVWTHISEASWDADSASIHRFHAAIAALEAAGLTPSVRHLAASAASFERADARFDMVRVGAFVYGIAPGDGIGPAQLGLRPALRLTTTVSSVDNRNGARVAMIPVGGVHGLYTDAAGAVDVTISGRRHRVRAVGSTRSEIDVTGTGIVAGDEVVLFGDGSSGEAVLQEWADAMGTIGEELVIRLAARAEHAYVD
ncbi:alanine racemase [Paramicrobacterium humi]|uniref:Alanine racemase n=1 Tax=Paramicrobacterium humi TaxID=640635 RepID=A0A1H4QKJ7_9MICO|nr:alanine racemase [Microbacterium humi]SEC20084.1 alanine racemase [Microbacterium humi]